MGGSSRDVWGAGAADPDRAVGPEQPGGEHGLPDGEGEAADTSLLQMGQGIGQGGGGLGGLLGSPLTLSAPHKVSRLLSSGHDSIISSWQLPHRSSSSCIPCSSCF